MSSLHATIIFLAILSPCNTISDCPLSMHTDISHYPLLHATLIFLFILSPCNTNISDCSLQAHWYFSSSSIAWNTIFFIILSSCSTDLIIIYSCNADCFFTYPLLMHCWCKFCHSSWWRTVGKKWKVCFTLMCIL